MSHSTHVLIQCNSILLMIRAACNCIVISEDLFGETKRAFVLNWIQQIVHNLCRQAYNAILHSAHAQFVIVFHQCCEQHAIASKCLETYQEGSGEQYCLGIVIM